MVGIGLIFMMLGWMFVMVWVRIWNVGVSFVVYVVLVCVSISVVVLLLIFEVLFVVIELFF